MNWEFPTIDAQEGEADAGLKPYRTDTNRFELRCGMCGEIYYADEQTFERFNSAMLAGLDNPLTCETCEEEYDELSHDG